jgi:glyoxylase-like metal-dependent hydrolase (beta-lactamase superfamily II)
MTYMAMSHYHADHTANANLFAGSTWIVQQAEYDIMFSETQVGIRTPESYKDLKDAKRIALKNADHDVFGDGTVVIKTAPGHTPGHQMLFLKLRNSGPLLLLGDLYHLPEEKTLDRVPTFEFDAAMTRATRKSVDTFIRQSGAKSWIQHDPVTYAPLKKSPQFYD